VGAPTVRTAIFRALVESLSGWVGGNHDNVRLVFVAFQGAMAMKRDTLITVLLVMAGIVLAFVLFGAGAFWKGRATPRRSSWLPFQPGCPYSAELGNSQGFEAAVPSSRPKRAI
jgi:hypothetical protein